MQNYTSESFGERHEEPGMLLAKTFVLNAYDGKGLNSISLAYQLEGFSVPQRDIFVGCEALRKPVTFVLLFLDRLLHVSSAISYSVTPFFYHYHVLPFHQSWCTAP